MEHSLLDGQSAPDKGDRVRIRVLRADSGQLGVDRPFKDKVLKLASGDGELTIPTKPGTYEVHGTVSTIALADSAGADYIVLNEYSVEHISDEHVKIEADDVEEDNTSVPDVDVDVDELLSDELTDEQDTSKGLSSGTKQLGDNYNNLLIGSK